MVSLGRRLAGIWGLWTATTLTPPVSLLLTGPFDGAPTQYDLIVTAGLFVLGSGVVGCWLAGRDDPAMELRDGLAAATPLVVGLLVALTAVPIWYLYGVTAAIPFAVGGWCGFVLSLVGTYVAEYSVVARARSTTSHHVQWRARKRRPPRWRRVSGWLILLVSTIWLGGVLIDGSLVGVVLPTLFGLSQLPTLLQGRVRKPYEIVDDGLLLRIGHLPWTELEGYSLTDDALVLHGRTWPFRTIPFDPDSIDDIETVVAALDRYLPEIDPATNGANSRFDDGRQVLGAK